MVFMEASDDYVLKVSNLSVKISNQQIIDNVTFKIKRGSSLAIVGPNGAGKTTLFRALLNLVPYRGKIEWGAKVKIGYVPQILSVRDVPISVKEFLSYKNESLQDMKAALASVGLDSEAIIDKSLATLSGGEMRRVLIAWAIVDNPDVLLFDEPTTGVDLDSEEAIYGMLKKLTVKNKITLLLISHDLHIVREYSDYALALNKCVVFFGASKDVMDPVTQKLIYGEPICKEFGEAYV
ncbi:metal ABC transporter ATP-binding protein [Candidatus Bathyarchaeota archaeon A05DMB-2]|jgi:zinc transport system ATP-binding protein|nr:metal ABC transporter ATP-binding protein [Candidatus Bathyarchaeota archaeon A05DMB-2]